MGPHSPTRLHTHIHMLAQAHMQVVLLAHGSHGKQTDKKEKKRKGSICLPILVTMFSFISFEKENHLTLRHPPPPQNPCAHQLSTKL